MLFASVIAGELWETHDPTIGFWVGAVFSLRALVMLICLRRQKLWRGAAFELVTQDCKEVSVDRGGFQANEKKGNLASQAKAGRQ
jgi:hypothetical protein